MTRASRDQDGVARILAHVISVPTLATFPVFLIGAYAPMMRDQLGMNPSQMGWAIAVFFTASAATASSFGPMIDRFGPRLGMGVSCAISSGTLLATAVLVQAAPALFVAFAAGGIANAFGQLSSNLVLARHIDPARQGLLFGAKQASIPLSGLLAGASVPALATTVGWRGAFAVGAISAGVVGLSIPSRLAQQGAILRGRPASVWATMRGEVGFGALRVLAGASMIATAAATALAVFLVDSAVHSGWSLSHAGILLALGNLLGIAARLAAGWTVDRRPSAVLRSVSVMMIAGALGYVLLALGAVLPTAFVIGTALSFCGGWAWSGLMLFSAVREHPRVPATATGILSSSGAIGAVVGPVIFGSLVERTSYTIAWGSAAVMLVVAAVLVSIAYSRYSRLRGTRGFGTATEP